jgi:hypothetical protein
MTDAQLDAVIDAVKGQGENPNKVEWDDLKAALKSIYNNQTSLTDLSPNTTSAFPKFDGSVWAASPMSVPNGAKIPQNNGNWGSGHQITPALRFDSTPGTGILAATWATSSTTAIAGHNGLEFISNYRRMISFYCTEETGTPGAVVIHGWGTNRLQLDSESNIVFISQTKRFEFEGTDGTDVEFHGYTSGSDFSRTIVFVSENQPGQPNKAAVPLAVKSAHGKDSFNVYKPSDGTVIGGFTELGHVFIPTTTYADDTAAATGGVKVGGLYWNGSVITQRRA